MNLVKAQEYAASLPLAELKKYADGLNPSMIPPWLATGEMEAKTRRAEMANNMQGAAQGQKPSVKEQVEKKAGLMQLQQLQQQQQQAAQAAPTGGPVPEGTPEPRQQPQEAGLDQLQSNIQMAGGGIVAFATGDQVKAGPEFIKFLRQMGIDYTDFVKSSAAAQDSIKDMFRSVQGEAAPASPAAQTVQGNASPKAFAAGQKLRPMLAAAKDAVLPRLGGIAGAGIAGYEGLRQVDDAKDFYNDPNVSMVDKAKQFSRTAANVGLPTAGGIAGSAVAPVAGTIGGTAAGAGIAALYNKLLDQFGGDELAAWKAAQAIAQKDNQSSAETARLNATAPAPDMGREGNRTSPVGEGVNPNANPSAIPANLRPAAKPPVAAAPNAAAPATANAPAATTSTAPAPGSMEAMFIDSLKNSPKERTVESLIAEQAAIDKALGLDEPAGKNKLERIADIKKQYAATQMTPMQEFISMLGQAGQYKGLSGFAPAYTNMAEKKRAADLAHAKEINELMGGVEDAQRGEKTATKTKVGTARDKDLENISQFNREKMQTLGTARGQDVQAASSKYSADSQYRAAMAQIKATAAREGMQQQRLLLDTFKTELSTIDKELTSYLKNPFTPEAKEKIPELQARKAGLTRALDEASGIGKMMGAPGAASPGGTKPGWGKASVEK